jgi:hypothetical protein
MAAAETATPARGHRVWEEWEIYTQREAIIGAGDGPWAEGSWPVQRKPNITPSLQSPGLVTVREGSRPSISLTCTSHTPRRGQTFIHMQEPGSLMRPTPSPVRHPIQVPTSTPLPTSTWGISHIARSHLVRRAWPVPVRCGAQPTTPEMAECGGVFVSTYRVVRGAIHLHERERE